MSIVELLGPKLLKGGEVIDTATAFEGKTAVALYFSAHWCPPCRGFTPKFAEYYTKNLKAKGLEVVFVSSDKDEGSFKEYYDEMPWLALPYSDRNKKAALSKKFKVQGIPHTAIINPVTGALVNSDGRTMVMKDPTGEKLPWIPPTFAELLGNTFLKGDGTVGKEAIAGKTLGLYFSAHWCPPCRSFTPMLAEWYKGVKGDVGDKFEIIFCSGDKSESAMKSYYKEQCDKGGDWLCLPFSNKGALDGMFEIEGIPTFYIVSPEGKMINKGAQSLVPHAKASDFPWAPPPIADMNGPAINQINESSGMCIFLESCTPEVQEKILATLTPIAAEYAAQDDPELIFLYTKKSGDVSTQIRTMCGLPSPSPGQPSLVLLDIPDQGGYYVGQITAELDGSTVKAMIAAWKNKELERKQLD
jgi:nucleoredoxin